MLKKAQKKVILLLIVIVSILLNLYTFVQAYPKTFMPTYHINVQQTLAKDFSAYYTAAWRLFRDPSNVYAQEPVNDGGPVPQPQAFRYLPSFLIFASPLLSLRYQDALIAFDVLQFLLLPVVAFLLYGLLKERSTLTIAVVIIIAILQPSPTSQWGLSASYFWQWAEGQDKVLNTALLLLALYLGKSQKPILSGAVLGLGAFDPRFFLLSLPLFALFNKLNLKRAGLSLIASLIVFNFPLLLVDGIGPGFLQMAFQQGTSSPLFYYAIIPLMTLSSLIVVNIKELYLLLRAGFSKLSEYSRLIMSRVISFGNDSR